MGRVCDAGTGELLSRLDDHTREIRDICFSPDGRVFVTGSRDGTARAYFTRVADLLQLARSRLPNKKMGSGTNDSASKIRY